MIALVAILIGFFILLIFTFSMDFIEKMEILERNNFNSISSLRFRTSTRNINNKLLADKKRVEKGQNIFTTFINFNVLGATLGILLFFLIEFQFIKNGLIMIISCFNFFSSTNEIIDNIFSYIGDAIIILIWVVFAVCFYLGIYLIYWYKIIIKEVRESGSKRNLHTRF